MDHQETISLKEFFEDKINSLEEKTNMRFDSLDKALNLAREDAKVKYEHLNALRSEVTTDRGLLVQTKDCKQAHERVDKEINLLREAKSQVEGRAVEKQEVRAQSNWSTGLSIVAGLSVVSIVLMIIHLFIGK
jgi:hypothetical protein